ncbi:hypothetical protein Sdel_1247 [Sulfurospirillum deleyianum DSM 6946]|uniref:Uncharacterized protein n=1 Tax=Sulfurospirillum deleyianum (strain ATCC 51133 / DSM 6946 / 5175) TaxID=525898 RepID=D1B2E9_SULD5|nr:hypothetical protein Sdel_1247 [Sulfurospirillum deleyianum DSM 6946]
MYTITIKIAASGTAYTNPDEPHNSLMSRAELKWAV